MSSLKDLQLTRDNLQILCDGMAKTMYEKGRELDMNHYLSTCGTSCCAIGAAYLMEDFKKYVQEFSPDKWGNIPFREFSDKVFPSLGNCIHTTHLEEILHVDFIEHENEVGFDDQDSVVWEYLFGCDNPDCVDAFKERAFKVIGALDELIKKENKDG